MNEYIRISTDFLSHPKIDSLKDSLGDEGIISLLRLWTYAGKYYYKGKLYDEDFCSEGFIESRAGWRGKPGLLINTLHKLGLLDKSSEKYEIHNWKKHNGNAMNTDIRSERARKAANKRWERQRQQDDAQSNANCIANGISSPN